MSTAPTISIIVPLCRLEQAEPARCLESLLGQTLREIEIICVDDASSAPLPACAGQDARVRLLHHTTPRGPAAARNTGLTAARAPYIMFCSADAWYAPQMCEKMLAAMQSAEGVDIALCGVQVHGALKRRQRRRCERLYRLAYRGVASACPAVAASIPPCLSSMLFRRSIITALGLSFAEDLPGDASVFYHSYLVHARAVFWEQEQLCHVQGGNLAGAPLQHVDAACRLRAYVLSAVNAGSLPELWRRHADALWKHGMQLYAAADPDGNSRRAAAALVHKHLGGAPLHSLPTPLLEGLALLLGVQEPLTLRRRWCGLLRETQDFTERRLCFLGLPLRRERFALEAASAPLHSLEPDNTALLRELRALGEFTYIPDQGNMGDALLAAATLSFFDAHRLPYRMLCELPEPTDVVVYGGGGIWIPDYEQEWLKFLPIFRRAKRVVILPSSFDRCDRLVEMLDERFTLFCREQRSYEYLRSTGCKASIILDHDMALRLPADFLAAGRAPRAPKAFRRCGLPRAYALLPTAEVGYLLRTDSESAALPPHPAAVDLSAYAGFSPRATRRELFFYARLMLCATGYFGAIVTDRLHVGIAAALMGRPVYLLDNTYKKLSGVYERSLQGAPHVHMAQELPTHLPPPQEPPLFAEHRRHHLHTRELWLRHLGTRFESLCPQAS